MGKNKNTKAKSKKLKFSKLLLSSHFSVPTSRKGMTLVELMVSMVILMLILGAIYSILNIQQTKASQVARTTVLQTDAQVASTLIKWDLMLAGLGYPYSSPDGAMLVPVGGVYGAGIGLKATGLGFEMNRSHWSYLLEAAGGNVLIVRRWADSLSNFAQNDEIVILNPMREPLAFPNLTITNNPRQDTVWYVDSVWHDSTPASRLVVSSSVGATAGLIVFKCDANTYTYGLTYSLAGDTLKRGSEVFLNNVEAIAFRYGIDNDRDGIVETWSDRNFPPNPGYNRKWAIRFTMVVTSEAVPGYTYPYDSVRVEASPVYTYPLDSSQRRRKRAILSSIIYPQNLQPGEEL